MRMLRMVVPFLALSAAAQSVAYPDGLVFDVSGVAADASGVRLTVKAQNGTGQAVELALQPRNDIWFKPMLVNDQGGQAFALPPNTNRTLKVPAGGAASFQLSFPGMRGEAFNLTFNAPKNVAVIGGFPRWEVPGIVARPPKVTPASAALNLSARTKNGAAFSLGRVSVDPDGIGLELRVAVPPEAKQGFDLASVNQACLSSDRRLTLIDARGRRYFPDYSRGLLADDQGLSVPARQQASGTLYFRPAPLPGAGPLRLVLNDCQRNDVSYAGQVLELPGIPLPK